MMNRILLMCDHYPLPPRVINMKKSILKFFPDAQIVIFAWNRENVEVVDKDVLTLDVEIGYGNQLKKLTHMIYVYKYIKKIIKKYQIELIHAIDFEMMFIASLLSFKGKLIYEVYDIKFFNTKVIDKLRLKLEKLSVKNKVDGMIFASPFFSKYYNNMNYKLPKHVTVNNKPLYNNELDINSGFMTPYKPYLEDKFVISFIGVLRYEEILKTLIKVLDKYEDMVLLLAGSGPSHTELEKFVKYNNYKRVIFTGRYLSSDLNSIYSVTDAVWAAYPNNDLNVKYAVSNKYYESQLFNKKIIVSNQTFLGDEILNRRLGLSVNPFSEHDIERVIESIKKFEYIVSDTSKKYWQNDERYIEELYSSLLY